MKGFYCIILSIISISAYAQDTFIRTYADANGEVRSMRQIEESDGRYFVLATGICDMSVECSELQEIDIDGNIIWQKKMKWLDSGFQSMMISGDSIIIAGNNQPSLSEFYVHYRTLEGDSITTYTLSDPNSPMIKMFALTLVEFDNKFILGATGRDTTNTYISSLIYSFYSDGLMDTIITQDSSRRNNSVRYLSVDQDEFLNTVISRIDSTGIHTKTYRKYDKQWNIVWEYTAIPRPGELFASSTMVDHPDGGIVFVNNSDDIWDWPKLYHVRADSTVAWESPVWENTKQSLDLQRLILSSDGNILGCGVWSDADAIADIGTEVSYAPIIFKMDLEGNVLWRSVINEPDSLASTPRNLAGLISDIVELPNGDIIGVGRLGSFELRKMVVRLSSDGCLKEDCGIYQTTATGDVVAAPSIRIFPNPVIGQSLSIDGLPIGLDIRYQILDVSGNKQSDGNFRSDAIVSQRYMLLLHLFDTS